MFSLPFFPYGICGVLYAIGMLAICVCIVFIRRKRDKLYVRLISRKQNWFPVTTGPILVDRTEKKPIAWCEVTVFDCVCSVVLKPGGLLYTKYVEKTSDHAIKMPDDAILEACVYSNQLVALRPSEGEIIPVWGKAGFKKDITPPAPEIVRFWWMRELLIRVMLVSLIPISFFGMVFLARIIH